MPAMGLQPFGATFEIFVALRGDLIKNITFVDASSAIDNSSSPGQYGKDHNDLFGIFKMLPLNLNSEY